LCNFFVKVSRLASDFKMDMQSAVECHGDLTQDELLANLQDTLAVARSAAYQDTVERLKALGPHDPVDVDEARFAEFGRILMAGCYADLLQDWFAEFGRDRFLVLEVKELNTDPVGVMEKVTKFVCRDEEQFEEYWTSRKEIVSDPNYWKDAGHQNKTHLEFELPGELEKELQAFYKPRNEALFALLGVNYGWNEKYAM